jgi:hypothetical protein
MENSDIMVVTTTALDFDRSDARDEVNYDVSGVAGTHG